jgi:release factor glutamine methyltransferase
LRLIEVLKRSAGYLEAHGSGSPRLDAELLLAHALGVRRLDLYLEHGRELSEADLAPYRALVGRRARGEPVAYLTGRKEFMKLEFEVTRAVLAPNPDTELLVRRAVEWARERGGAVRVADVGTGSGCIAVSVAHYVPEADVAAIDVDPAAAAVARANARRHGVAARVEVLEGDMLAPLEGSFDLVCANLPYLSAAAALPAEVRAQPKSALFAGPRGSELVVRLLEEAPAFLRPRGAVLAEIDPHLLGDIEPALGPYAGHRIHRDLAGHERLLEAWNG